MVPHHRDGNESNTRKGNLAWLCKSCNTRLGKEFARIGKGVRTRQYNPGATNLAQYVQAAMDHIRGAHDAGGKVIHETPKPRRRSYARDIWLSRKAHGNPKKKVRRRNASTAAGLYESFHGRRPPRGLENTNAPQVDYSNHPELAQLGKLVSVWVGEGVKLTGSYLDKAEWLEEDGWCQKIEFERVESPDVAAEPGGNQIYFIRGNQNVAPLLAQLDADARKDLIDLGPCIRIEYHTEKGFDRFKPINYFHALGEEDVDDHEYPMGTDASPRLMFNRRLNRLYLVGGHYKIKPDGIVN